MLDKETVRKYYLLTMTRDFHNWGLLPLHDMPNDDICKRFEQQKERWNEGAVVDGQPILQNFMRFFKWYCPREYGGLQN